MLSSTVDKNGYFISTKMPIFSNFGNSSQRSKFDAGQNSTVDTTVEQYNSSLSYSITNILIIIIIIIIITITIIIIIIITVFIHAFRRASMRLQV